jgi:hypothetical protein
MRRRKGRDRWARTAAGVALSIVASLAATEAFFGWLNSGAPPVEWVRPIRVDASLASRQRGEAASPLRLRATLGDLPVINPEPKEEKLESLALADFSQAQPANLYREAARMAPNLRFRSIVRLKSDRRVLQDVEVSFDGEGRRITPNPGAGRTRHLLVYGCSYAFGEGVGDADTLPAQLARFAPGYRVYNYGRPGGGVYESLIRIEDNELEAEVPEKSGLAIYLYITDHIRRIPPSVYSLRHRMDGPYFHVNEDGTIDRAPSFAQARPLEAWFYRMLIASQTVRYFGFDYPLEFGAERMRQTATLIRGIAERHRRRFPGDDFVVVTFPEGPMTPGMGAYLEEAGVRHLDYGNQRLDIRLAGSSRVGPHDGHPSPEAYRVVASRIARDLGLARR